MRRVVLLKSGCSQEGGLEKYASRIANGFAAQGDRVSILTTGKGFSSSGIPMIPIQTSKWPPFLRLEQFDRSVRKWIQENGADLVFGMDRNREQTHLRAGNGSHAAYLESRLLAEGKGKALLCRWNPLHRKILELEKTAFESRQLQKLFANSHMVKEQILNRYAVDPSKIEVIHNGVEWNEMELHFADWERKKEEAMEKFSLDKNCFHFLFIGNGYLRKGLDRLLAALSVMKTEPFQLSVVGKDRRQEAYQAQAESLGLKNKVHFFGPALQTAPFYQFADSLVIPSFYDPFANVTIEALAMGLFVVSSKWNGGHEILTPLNGIGIENLLNKEALVDSLRYAMKKKKTKKSGDEIRKSVKHLDFSRQLNLLIKSCG